MTAGPGGKEYGYLSILVSYYCEVERLFKYHMEKLGAA